MAVRLMPLVLLSLYIVSGLLISIYGPVIYEDYSYDLVTAYLTSFLILFAIGYGFGLATPSPSVPSTPEDNRALVDFIFRVSVVASLMILLADLSIRVASGSLNLDVSGLGKAYVQSYTDYERNTGSYSLGFILATLGAVPSAIASVWGLYYIRRLSFAGKILILLLIVSTVALSTIGQGKQKQLGDFAIFVASLLAIGFGSRGRIRVRDVVTSLAVTVTAVCLLGYVLAQRYAAINVNFDNINQKIHPLTRVNEQSNLFHLLGDNVGFPLMMLSQYLSGGYYGLSLGLKLDFYWTWFLGWSYSLSVIANRWFGFPFMYDQTYPVRIGRESGWGESKWHTIFSWLASDMTYPGALIFLGGIGFIYARTWKECISYRNPFSVLLFCLLNVGLVYIPANNQLVHSPGGLALLFVTFFLYFTYGPRFNSLPQAR